MTVDLYLGDNSLGAPNDLVMRIRGVIQQSITRDTGVEVSVFSASAQSVDYRREQEPSAGLLASTNREVHFGRVPVVRLSAPRDSARSINSFNRTPTQEVEVVEEAIRLLGRYRSPGVEMPPVAGAASRSADMAQEAADSLGVPVDQAIRITDLSRAPSDVARVLDIPDRDWALSRGASLLVPSLEPAPLRRLGLFRRGDAVLPAVTDTATKVVGFSRFASEKLNIDGRLSIVQVIWGPDNQPSPVLIIIDTGPVAAVSTSASEAL